MTLLLAAGALAGCQSPDRLARPRATSVAGREAADRPGGRVATAGPQGYFAGTRVE